MLRAGLAGDHLRVIAKKGVEAEELERALKEAGAQAQSVQAGEPSLEDVFVQLSKA